MLVSFSILLKLDHEPIVLARKPLSEKTIAENVVKWGTGGINIEDSRIGDEVISSHHTRTGTFAGGKVDRGSDINYYNAVGRFPANIMLDEDTAKVLDDESKVGASKFFYVSKATKKDRNEGCEELEEKGVDINSPHNSKTLEERYAMSSKNNHPTVKPTTLMEYLIKLVTPKGGIVLDPFMGSGSTGKAAVKNGFNFIGMEKDPEYFKIAEARINFVKN